MAAAVPAPDNDLDAFRKPGRFAAFSALLAPRPTGAWFGIFGGVVVLAFGIGLLTGRASAPAAPAASEPATSAAPKPPKVREAAPASPPAANPEPAKKESTEEPHRAEGGKGTKAAFNQKLARAAVDRAAARARGCRDKADAPGSASVTITFAPSGKASDVTVTTPRYASSKTGKCIVSRMSEARVPEFSGNSVTLKKTVSLK